MRELDEQEKAGCEGHSKNGHTGDGRRRGGAVGNGLMSDDE